MDILERYKKQVEDREKKRGDIKQPNEYFIDYTKDRNEYYQKQMSKYHGTPITQLIRDNKQFSVARAIMPHTYDYMHGFFHTRNGESIQDILHALHTRYPHESIEISHMSASRYIRGDGVFQLSIICNVCDAQFEKLIYSAPSELTDKKDQHRLCYPFRALHFNLRKTHTEFQQRRYYQQMTSRMFPQLPEALCLEIASYCHALKPSPPPPPPTRV